MGLHLKLAAAAAVALVGAAFAHPASAAECGTDRKIDIAEMGWPSAAALARIHATILEKGYGCTVELVPGDTVPTLAAMVSKGEPALAPELWPNASKEAWEKGARRRHGRQSGAGDRRGPGAGLVHPDLRRRGASRPEDRSRTCRKFASLFADPDDPSKGRFVSCPPGWACEIMDANFFKAYGLGETFNLFSPGSAGALDATISQAFPQAGTDRLLLLGADRDDGAVRHDPAGRWRRSTQPSSPASAMPACANPEKTDFIVPDAVKAAASWLPQEAPVVAEYLGKVSLTNAEVGRMLVWGEENKADAQAVAENFLKTEEAIWSNWVPAEVAEAVKASLN